MDSLRSDKPPPYQELKEASDSSPPQGSAPALVASVQQEPIHLSYDNNGLGRTMTATPYPVLLQQPQPAPSTVVVVNTGDRAGGKARCHVCNYGKLKNHYSCCAWLWCLCCFPLGGCICCLCMRNKKCNHCGIEF